MTDAESEVSVRAPKQAEEARASAGAEETAAVQLNDDSQPLDDASAEDDKLRHLAEALATSLAQIQEDNEKAAQDIVVDANDEASEVDAAPDTSPMTLAQVIKKLILLHVARSFPAIRNQVIHNAREQFVGVDRIKRLILDGYSPEQIGDVIVPHDRLVSDFKLLAEYIAFVTLGIALTQTIQPLNAVLRTNDEDQAAFSLQSNVTYLSSLPPPTDEVDSLPAINYDPLVDFVEAQKTPGSPLENDPEWEDLGKKPKQRWDKRLSVSVESLGKKFNEACNADEHVWSAAIDIVVKQIENARDDKVYELVKAITASEEEKALPQIPLRVGDPTHTAPVDLAAHGSLLCSVASAFKAGLQ